MVMIFENLKKIDAFANVVLWFTYQQKFEKDWPTLLPDCFAWFSHRQALKYTHVYETSKNLNN